MDDISDLDYKKITPRMGRYSNLYNGVSRCTCIRNRQIVVG